MVDRKSERSDTKEHAPFRLEVFRDSNCRLYLQDISSMNVVRRVLYGNIFKVLGKSLINRLTPRPERFYILKGAWRKWIVDSQILQKASAYFFVNLSKNPIYI